MFHIYKCDDRIKHFVRTYSWYSSRDIFDFTEGKMNTLHWITLHKMRRNPMQCIHLALREVKNITWWISWINFVLFEHALFCLDFVLDCTDECLVDGHTCLATIQGHKCECLQVPNKDWRLTVCSGMSSFKPFVSEEHLIGLFSV